MDVTIKFYEDTDMGLYEDEALVTYFAYQLQAVLFSSQPPSSKIFSLIFSDGDWFTEVISLNDLTTKVTQTVDL